MPKEQWKDMKLTKPEITAREASIKSVIDKTNEELLSILEQMYPTDAYFVISSHLTDDQIKSITDTPDHRRMVNMLKKRGLESVGYDRSAARMWDIDVACSKMYAIIMEQMMARLRIFTNSLLEINNRLDACYKAIEKANGTSDAQQPESPGIEPAPTQQPTEQTNQPESIEEGTHKE